MIEIVPESSDASHNVMTFFLIVAALVTVARLFGAVARRFNQPAVLGELIAGLFLGPSVLGIVDASTTTFSGHGLHLFAEFGVVLLLFQIGLHTDLRSLIRVGGASVAVAFIGVVLPFAGGMAIGRFFGLESLPSIIIGAALTATSVGISARVLEDLKYLGSTEGQTVLGAAVIDDIVGLIILAIVAQMASGGAVTLGSVSLTTAMALGFLVVVIGLGTIAAPRLFALIDRIPARNTTGVLAVAFALVLAALAERAGSAPIIGAFAAGLVLHPTPQRQRIELESAVLSEWFVPIFFASVGAMIDLHALRSPDALLIGSSLLVVGILTKYLAGYAPYWQKMRYGLMGVAMIPRGEVGLIFAQKGLDTNQLSPALFGALMLMVIGTTLVTPPWLAAEVNRAQKNQGNGMSGVSTEREP